MKKFLVLFTLTTTVLQTNAAQPGLGPNDAERQYDASCSNVTDIVEGIHPDAWAWSPVHFARENIADIGVSDPIMLTVICESKPQVVCMEIYSEAKAKGLPVEMRGRIRSIETDVVYLDPCHSILVE